MGIFDWFFDNDTSAKEDIDDYYKQLGKEYGDDDEKVWGADYRSSCGDSDCANKD